MKIRKALSFVCGLAVTFIPLYIPVKAQTSYLMSQANPDVKFLLERGQRKAEAGDLKGALKDFDRVIALDSQHAQAYSNRGAARSALGDKQGAIADYNQALKINPQFAQAYYRRGNARSALGDKQGAIADYSQAIKIDPQYYQAYNNRGNTRSALGDKQGAIADFTQAIKINPQYTLAQNNLKNTRSALAEKKPAIEESSKISKATSGSVASKQVSALVTALRRSAPPTNSSEFLSPWKVKRENITRWAKFCKTNITPEEFANSLEKAQQLVTCIVEDLLKEEMANSNNREDVAILRSAAWWMTGDAAAYEKQPTATYTQKVLGIYKKLLP